jgi:GrpB-like predicted nucleotidyltransferase (UPF0157 family)
MARKIEIVPYNPVWPDLFEAETAQLAAVFGPEVVAIHHIGSTSIPGIQAKPIIDILLEVKEITRVDAFNEAMTRLGYTPKGEFGIAGRRYFCKTVDTLHTHHVHAFQTGHPEVARHVDFRDYLRAHPVEAQAYSQLKEKLAQRFPLDPEGYTNAKSEFIGGIDKKAGTWKEA